jgi:hypothetical protein
MDTIIDALYRQNQEALDLAVRSREVSIASDLDNKLKKHLIVAAASYFETEICALIEEFAGKASGQNPAIIALIKKKIIERQYHTMFAWESRNANSFFSMFGEPFNGQCRSAVRSESGLEEAMVAFLELGEMRNLMVHRNFASHPIDKTSEEVYALYKSAGRFLEFVKGSLRQASSGSSSVV